MLKSNVIPFRTAQASPGFLRISLPATVDKKYGGEFGYRIVRGDEFRGENIFDKDRVVYAKRFRETEITKRLCIVEIDGFEGTYLRRIIKTQSCSLLTGPDNETQPVAVVHGQFTVRGVVIGVYRSGEYHSIDPLGRRSVRCLDSVMEEENGN